jgi:two-component system, NarL family, nitrate/nitrite response regulator NarL
MLSVVVLRCLIVDDNELFLDSARTLLEREGVDVVGTATTPDGATADALRLRPDVVLVDVMLGDRSGFELAGRLDRAGCAVVMISTLAAIDLEELLADSPARGFLAKAELSGKALRELLAVN